MDDTGTGIRGTVRQLRPVLLIVAALLAAVAGGCERHTTMADAFAEPLTRADTCVVDGMILLDHPGPKGQIVLPDGTRRAYCDLKELFEAWFDRARTPQGAVAFVQPMDERPWGSYADGWVRVGQARYVLGSPLAGAMGPTLVPFRNAEAAQRFVGRHGGRVVAYEALGGDVIAAYVREVRDMMRAGRVVVPGAQAVARMPGMSHGGMPQGAVHPPAAEGDMPHGATAADR